MISAFIWPAPETLTFVGSTGKFRELQRLTVQYARVLELTVDQDGDDDAMAVETT